MTLINRLIVNPGTIVGSTGGIFKNFTHADKDRSSNVNLLTNSGVVEKDKERSPNKMLWEYFSLMIWHKVCSTYSAVTSNPSLRAPKPLGLKNEHAFFMEYITGFPIKKAGEFPNKDLKLQVSGVREYLSVKQALAYHLGALFSMKEKEGIYHADLDSRHVYFDPTNFQFGPFMGVIDVENSRAESINKVQDEHKRMLNFFEKHFGNHSDYKDLLGYLEKGYDNLKTPYFKILDVVVADLSSTYKVDIDFYNMKLNPRIV